MLAVLAPCLALLALAIWMESGTPVIFRAQRLGRGGRPFTMYKLRSMAPGSDEALDALMSSNLAEGMVKIADDPRVTPLGRLLRRFSLDELPQLWNVLRGDMSLVGPRPHELKEVSLQDNVHARRLTMRPGLTGLWQVRARTNPSLAVRVHYDLEYLNRWSLRLDLAIALSTIPVLLRGEGGQIHRPELGRGRARSATTRRVDGQDLVPEVPPGDRADREGCRIQRRQHGPRFPIGRQHDQRLAGRRERSTESAGEALDHIGGTPG
ncbi:MAG: sugar transferase [Chloroflexi bacterium]|nr:MAG: sugar transferase [Chloroflexota bacterium]